METCQMKNSPKHTSAETKKYFDKQNVIKEGQERCDLENCTLERKGSLCLQLKPIENKPSGNWRRKMKSQRKSPRTSVDRPLLVLKLERLGKV